MNICPLMSFRPLSHPTSISDVLGSGREAYEPVECMGDRCAWFNYGEDECAVLVVAMRLGPIADFHEVTMP